MLLAVDVGNTNVTLALASSGDPASLGRLRRAGSRRDVTADELEASLDGLLRLDGHALTDVEAIVAASVVPAYTAALDAIAAAGASPSCTPTRRPCRSASASDRPDDAGADRLVNAYAVGRLYGRPAIVVDFGTATTLDVVGPDGTYLGGSIAPGLELGIEALAHAHRAPAAHRAAAAPNGPSVATPSAPCRRAPCWATWA